MRIKDNIKFSFNTSCSTGNEDCQNILIHGDNKDVLTELWPEYASKIRCIYIDPPYNNGETYHYYDDNNNQGDWLRNMCCVLNLLKPLMSKDGSIWISIDDSEMAYLRVEADSIFGRENFAGTIIWQQRKSRENRAVFSCNHEYILVYAKDLKEFKKKRNLLPVGADFIDCKYKNPDNDPRGPWQSVTANVQAGHAVPSQFYTVISPTGVRHDPPKGRCWIYNEERMKREIAQGNIWFGRDGSSTPRVKKFLRDAKIGLTPETIWLADEVGTSDSAKKQLMTLFPEKENIFETPKPEELLKRIIEIASNEGDYVLDCYIGSGTTMATAHKLNRHYIGIEIGNQMSELVVKRMNMVVDGDKTGISESIGWSGGGHFVFYNYDKTKSRQNTGHASVPVFHGNTFERLRTAAVRQLDLFDLFQCETDSVDNNHLVREDHGNHDAIKEKTQDWLGDRNIKDIESKSCLFTLQLKPVVVDSYDDESGSFLDRLDSVIEKKYFHTLLGKAFRPYKKEEYLYLSLESKPEYYDDNMKLLSDLSKDFNIRHYILGTDPRAVINKFADLTFAPAKGKGKESHVFRFEDFKDEIFLVGGYRSGDKNQLDWITEHLMYNIRVSINRHGHTNGIIDEYVVSARYLVLYEINDKEKRNYHIYRIDSWKTRSTEWMATNGYEKPNGPYIVYSLLEETNFEQANVNAMLNIGLYNEIAFRKTKGEEVSKEWLRKEWYGAPVFLTGQQINDYALASHKDCNKSLIVVDIGDSDLSKIGIGYSAGLFVVPKTLQAIKDFTSAGYLVYSNKKKHKIYRVQGNACISIDALDGHLQRRYAEPLREIYPDRKDRDKAIPDIYLSFNLEPADNSIHLNQTKINKVPKGLSSYDAHVVDITSLVSEENDS